MTAWLNSRAEERFESQLNDGMESAELIVVFKVVDEPEAPPDCAIEITKRGFAFALHREAARRQIIKAPAFRSRFVYGCNKQSSALVIALLIQCFHGLGDQRVIGREVKLRLLLSAGRDAKRSGEQPNGKACCASTGFHRCLECKSAATNQLIWITRKSILL